MNASRTCAGCGSTLSRYNPDVLCAACQRAGSRSSAPDASRRAYVPTWVWDSPVLRAALAKTDLGAVMAAFRAEAGLSQLEVAQIAGCAQSTIWRIEAGERGQEMIAAIVDVAHALAERLTEAGDPAAARAAAARGLEVEPGSELLYRDLFRAEHRAGNAAGIEEAAERLMVTLAELDLDMEPETADLLSRLRGRRRVASSPASPGHAAARATAGFGVYLAKGHPLES